MRLSIRILKVLGAAIVTGAFGVASVARGAVSADKITTSPAACQVASINSVLGPTPNLDGRDTTGTPPNNNAFGQRVSLAGNVTLICPADGFATIDVTSVTVDVWQNSDNGVTTKACVNFVGGFGGTCGATLLGGSSVGIKHLTPSTMTWISSPNDFRFLLVKMEGAGNSLFGYRQN